MLISRCLSRDIIYCEAYNLTRVGRNTDILKPAMTSSSDHFFAAVCLSRNAFGDEFRRRKYFTKNIKAIRTIRTFEHIFLCRRISRSRFARSVLID